jgi:hypothetical protein
MLGKLGHLMSSAGMISGRPMGGWMLGKSLDKSILGNGIFGKVILKACKRKSQLRQCFTPNK